MTALDKIGLKLLFCGNSKLAQAVLLDYVNFVNQFVLNQINKEFKLGFNLHLDALKFTKNQIEEKFN